MQSNCRYAEQFMRTTFSERNPDVHSRRYLFEDSVLDYGLRC